MASLVDGYYTCRQGHINRSGYKIDGWSFNYKHARKYLETIREFTRQEALEFLRKMRKDPTPLQKWPACFRIENLMTVEFYKSMVE